MSREEHDREDLLREAKALVARVELQLPGNAGTWVVGFRRDGAASLFVDFDPVFQFNAAHELRRAYVGGKLVKAEQGRLVGLVRVRTEHEIQLVRYPFTAAEVAEFAALLRHCCLELRRHLAQSRCVVLGQVPVEADLPARVLAWLDTLPEPIRIAASPRAGQVTPRPLGAGEPDPETLFARLAKLSLRLKSERVPSDSALDLG